MTTACSLLLSTDDLTGGDTRPGESSGDARVSVTSGDGQSAAGDGASTPDDGDGAKDGPASDVAVGTGEPGCSPTSDLSLVVHYTFDEGVGTKITDCSPNHLDAVVAGAADWTSTPPRAGSHALTFDGATSCATLPASPLLELAGKPFTIATWVHIRVFSAGTSGKFILSKTTNNAIKGFRFATDDGNIINFNVGQASGTNTGVATSKLTPLTWVHVAVTVDPATTTANIYVNGTLAKSRSTMPGMIEDPTVAAHLGCDSDGTNLLASSLDDFRLYSRILTVEQIKALAQ